MPLNFIWKKTIILLDTNRYFIYKWEKMIKMTLISNLSPTITNGILNVEIIFNFR